MASFLVKDSFYADEKKGKINHRINKIRMHGGKGDPVAAENIDEASGKSSSAAALHAKAIAGKSPAGKI